VARARLGAAARALAGDVGGAVGGAVATIEAELWHELWRRDRGVRGSWWQRVRGLVRNR
jgi:hypothetical protein